jgi:hypothetical protein
MLNLKVDLLNRRMKFAKGAMSQPNDSPRGGAVLLRNLNGELPANFEEIKLTQAYHQISAGRQK